MNWKSLIPFLEKILFGSGTALLTGGIATKEEWATFSGAAAIVLALGGTFLCRYLFNKRIPPAAPLLILSLLLLSGCTTATTGARQVDWDSVAGVTRLAAKYTTKTILDKNPAYAESVAAINGSISALFVGTPTAESLAGTITVIAPELSPADNKLLVALIMDAYDLYSKKTGEVVLIPLNPTVQLLVEALTNGIREGTALHNETLPASTQ